jgi:hypothetical protein
LQGSSWDSFAPAQEILVAVVLWMREEKGFSRSGIREKDWQQTNCSLLKGLLFQDAFEPVTEIGAHNKDEHEDHNLDKNTEHSQETDTNTYAVVNKKHRDQHENNTQDDADNRTIFEEAHEVFFPLVKKAKCYTEDEIQQFKPHANTPDLKQNITLQPLNRFRVATGVSACHFRDYNAVRDRVGKYEENQSIRAG